MSRVVTEYKGIKYSLQPHGLRSRLLVAFAFFVVVFGGALLAATPAQAAGPAYVNVCGNSSTWYVNDDETTRAPLGTPGGLVFGPTDLIHFAVDIPLAELTNPTGLGYAASPAPDQPSFYSVEVRSGAGAYGTLRWDGTNWSITIGPGADLPGHVAVTPGTSSGPDPVALLAGKVTKWGAFDPATNHVVSFGVGYTQNPPGTVTTAVSSVSFQQGSISFVCPVVLSPTPVATTTPPKKATTTTKAAAVIATGKTCAQIGHRVHRGDPDYTTKLDADGDGVGCEAYPESVIVTPAPTETSTPSATPQPSHTPPSSVGELPVEGETTGHSSLVGWGIALAAVGGVTLTILGVAGLTRSRRYQGAHHVDGQTQVMPAIAPDEHSVSDYDPSTGDYDPALGGSAGESYRGGQDTAEMPQVKE